MSTVLPRIESGLFPGSEPSVPYSRILPHAPSLFKAAAPFDSFHPLHSVHKSRTTVVSSLLDRAAADKWLHALNAVALENSVSADFVQAPPGLFPSQKAASFGGNVHVAFAPFRHQNS